MTGRRKEPIHLQHVELFSCPGSLFKYWLSKEPSRAEENALLLLERICRLLDDGSTTNLRVGEDVELIAAAR